MFSGYAFTQRQSEVQQEADRITARYMHAQELLASVRAQVLFTSVVIRDALLDPNPSATAEYRRQIEEAFQAIDRDLNEYAPVLDSAAERTQIEQLGRQIRDFRTTLSDVLAGDSTQWASQARMLLQSRIMPRREEVIRLSEEVQTLNRLAYVRQQAATTEVYRITQRYNWLQIGLALVVTFVIGLVVIGHVGYLERQLRAQQAKDAENTRDLQRLSSQLITAQEAERRTIARELHDEVGQVLTAIKMELAVAQRAIESSGGSPQLLAEARQITEGALHTVRDLSRLLHPAILDDLGLPAALEASLREFSNRYGVRVDLVQEQMTERLAAETEVAAYRIVQEALTNIARHAHAAIARVYLQRVMNTIRITIEDDGVGFDAEQLQRSGTREGFGLLGVRERVAQLGGEMRLESVPGRGARLTVVLPANRRLADGQTPPAGRLEPELSHG